MITKQILFSALLLGTVSTVGLAMKLDPNAKYFNQKNVRRFNNGWNTHLNDCNHCNLIMSALNIYCTDNDKIDFIEVSYDNKEIKKGTVKELKTSRLGSPKFNGAWDPIGRNNAFFDSEQQAIFYGNVFEMNEPLQAHLQLIEKTIQIMNEKLLGLEKNLVELSHNKETDQYKTIEEKIKKVENILNIFYQKYTTL